MVVLVAEFERRAGGGIAEGLHAADQLIRTESRVVGTALLIGDDAVDGIRDMGLKRRDDRRLFGLLLRRPWSMILTCFIRK